jgi:hypothetical protein
MWRLFAKLGNNHLLRLLHRASRRPLSVVSEHQVPGVALGSERTTWLWRSASESGVEPAVLVLLDGKD